MAKKQTTGAACPRADIGGQAVLDGVMMKSPSAVALTVTFFVPAGREKS